MGGSIDMCCDDARHKGLLRVYFCCERWSEAGYDGQIGTLPVFPVIAVLLQQFVLPLRKLYVLNGLPGILIVCSSIYLSHLTHKLLHCVRIGGQRGEAEQPEVCMRC